MTSTTFIAGFIAQASLILVIGAQNSFVLRQGLLRSHIGAVVAFCIISDILLATLGVMGLTSVVTLYPALVQVMEYAAVAFLLIYAGFSFWRAYQGPQRQDTAGASNISLYTALGLMAGFTWANPHVWLDTVLLLGTVAQTQPAGTKLPFLIGASIASTIWFLALGYGARILQPLFMNPVAWRVLDLVTGVMMVGLVAVLI